MEAWVVATGLIFLYLLVTIVLGIVANRQLSVDLEDFLLYGRKAGFIVLYLTVVATYHFATGNEPSVTRAVTHCFFDVLTFGLWEIAGVMIERAVDEKDTEVRVVYAGNDQVIAMHDAEPIREDDETVIVTAESDAPE